MTNAPKQFPSFKLSSFCIVFIWKLVEKKLMFQTFITHISVNGIWKKYLSVFFNVNK